MCEELKNILHIMYSSQQVLHSGCVCALGGDARAHVQE